MRPDEVTEPFDEQALARCVGDVEHFRSCVWGRAPALHVGAGPFTDLLDVADVELLLGLLGRRPGFRLVADGGTLPTDSYTTSIRVGGRLVDEVADLDRVLDHVAAGATVVLQGLQRTWLPLSTFCEQLERALSHPVQANAYLSPPQAAAFRRHVDEHGVFALQVAGRKSWDIEGLGELVLEPGDALYLPAGTAHEARSTDQLSLHVTIGVLAVMWADVLRRAVGDVEQLSQPLPLGWSHPGRHEDVTASLRRAVGNAVEHLLGLDVDDTVEREVVLRRRRQRRLPLGRLQAAVDPASIDDRVRLRRRVPASVTHLDGHATLEFAERRLRLPAATGPALDVVVHQDEFDVGDLPGLDAQDRSVLARRLVREGLLVPVPGRR